MRADRMEPWVFVNPGLRPGLDHITWTMFVTPRADAIDAIGSLRHRHRWRVLSTAASHVL